MLPWPLVALIDTLAWHLGYTTYVKAVGGSGWHRGRFGADRIHFLKRQGDEVRLPRLKAKRT